MYVGGGGTQTRRMRDQDTIYDFKIKRTTPKIPALMNTQTGSSSTTFNLVEQMQYLYVRIVRARDLFDQTTTAFDSYVEVKVGNYKGITSTTTHNKTPNPEWNHVFAFSKDRIHSSHMEIIVRQKTTSMKGGGVVYTINEVPTRLPPDSPLAPQWCKLEGMRGYIMVAVWIGTQADEVFSEAWHSDNCDISIDGMMNMRSKVYLSPKLWYLRVNVIQVQDLELDVGPNNNKRPEVFIRAIVGNTVLRSRVSVHTPFWNEDLLFVVAEPFEHQLVLSVVENRNGNKEEILGKCNIHLHSLERRQFNKPVDARWYCLEKPEEKGNSKIHLRLSLDGGYHVLDESTHCTSDLRPTIKQLWKSGIGVLELGILNATGLPPMKKKKKDESIGTTDAYCVAKYGQKWVKTRTIIDCLTPQWNEQYTWEVFDPCTVITIAVFDNSHLNTNDDDGGNHKDLRIGKIKIRLSTLEANKIYTNSYPLVMLHPQGVKKMGEIQLAIRFSSSSLFSLLQTYYEPILPRMHYQLPLSVYQLDYLRYQASQILAMRLSRSEPPLRKEVVEYMLDVGSRSGWSSRKCKANYQRIKDGLYDVVVLLEFFNYICSWERPVVTVMVHFMVLIMIVYPRLILPSLFFYLFVLGLWNYRRREQDPLYMDVKLSYVDKVGFEELDEEFDSFPSSKNVDVVRVRYDRLRGVAGRVQAVIGDLANQVERLKSVLSWRDPRATGLFVGFCLVACVVLYATPFKLVATSLGFYLLRHPKFRHNLPSAPLNFIRRLPARSDCLL